MITLLFYFIVFCLFVGLGCYILQQALANVPIAQPLKQLILAAFLFICLLVLIGFFFGSIPLPHLRMMY